MQWFWIRISGAFLLSGQAVLLQLLWIFEPGLAAVVSIFIVFEILTVLCLLALIGFLFLSRVAWLIAMMVQGLCLFVSLLVYFEEALLAPQLTMVYSIIMVLYLNSFLVRAAFDAYADNGQMGGVDE